MLYSIGNDDITLYLTIIILYNNVYFTTIIYIKQCMCITIIKNMQKNFIPGPYVLCTKRMERKKKKQRRNIKKSRLENSTYTYLIIYYVISEFLKQ